jgi:hypothetical protein
MEENKTPVEVLLEHSQAYVKTGIQLFKFKATDKVAEIVSNIASGFVILILLTLLFLNLNVGIALLIGNSLGKLWLGFLILSGFYGFVLLIVYLFRNRWIKKPIANSVITQLLKEEQVNDEKSSDH